MTNKPSSAASPDAISADVKLPGQTRFAGPLRAFLVLAGFLALTVPLMPVQLLLLRISLNGARKFPHWYHKRVCRLLGIRIHMDGNVEGGRSVLLVSNHVSWLDIPVLSAVAPLSFIAKSEVRRWPFVSWLARLQRTVFVDRGRRRDVGRVTSEMQARLTSGDILVLFAEGTSTDGTRVLPFKTALMAPVFAGQSGSLSDEREGRDDVNGSDTVVQPLSLVYTHLHGIPIGRAQRSLIGWYGDMGMASHGWGVLKAGPIDVRITIGEPVALANFSGRKDLAQHAEARVREGVVRALRGHPVAA